MRPNQSIILHLAGQLVAAYAMLNQSSPATDLAEVDTLECMISALQATSLEDAAVHVMMALDCVETGVADEEDRERARRLLWSALNAIVQQTGIDLVAYGADAYAPAHLNPWEAVQKDFDAAVAVFDSAGETLPMDATEAMAQAAMRATRIKPDVARTLWRVMAATFIGGPEVKA